MPEPTEDPRTEPDEANPIPEETATPPDSETGEVAPTDPAEPPAPEEPELMDSLPVLEDNPMHEAASDGQLLEACPACGTLMDVTLQDPFSKIHCPSCGQALRARKQFNHYKLLELIGQGGMGQVFKALDCNLNRHVALKVLKRELASSPEEREKLAAEARITASINHPYVVKVFSFGQDHGQFYMAMELIPNASLDDLLTLQRRVPEMQVLQIGIQIAEGLQAALEKDLIHRDIKPGNILFADAHTAKLVDFGLAIIMDEAAAAVGEIWGTPYYIAPEKLDNQPEDFRSDIYSLGGTLFHALAGRPPYEAETASMVALKQLKSQPISLQAFAPDVSSETAYVINRMIAKNADDRYASYAELIEHLGYAKNKLTERIKRPPQPKARVVLETKETRNFTAWITLVLLIVALVAGGVIYLYRDQIFPEIAKVAPGSFVKEEFDDSFANAVKLMANSQFDEARSEFRNLSGTPEITQPHKNWALMNEGLAALFLGDKAGAAALFEQIYKADLYSSAEPDVAAANFFVEANRLLAQQDKVIDRRTSSLYSNASFESFGLFCFAMHNWELGDLVNAEPILRTFVSGRSPKDYPWIGDYKTLAKPYREDAHLVLGLKRKVDTAATPEAAKALLPEIEAARAALTTGSKPAEVLDQLVEQINK
ncbi:MAG: serine/threonine-protein kinase [Terrimicrobiaceae bacterium]